jgi:hypothetical protein
VGPVDAVSAELGPGAAGFPLSAVEGFQTGSLGFACWAWA